MTATSDRFKYEMERLSKKVYGSGLLFSDAVAVLDLCENLYLRYEEVRESRENWKTKYNKLKNS